MPVAGDPRHIRGIIGIPLHFNSCLTATTVSNLDVAPVSISGPHVEKAVHRDRDISVRTTSGTIKSSSSIASASEESDVVGSGNRSRH